MPTSEVPGQVRAFLGKVWPEAGEVAALAGDASTRRYFRANGREGGETRIVALHYQGFDPASFPFLETTSLFQQVQVRVPAVLEVDGPGGLLLLEDLGDLSLQQALSEPRTDHAALYRQAVEIIVRLQRDGTPAVHAGIHAGREALDKTRLRFELDYFLEHLVCGLRGQTLISTQKNDLDRAFTDLCQRLHDEPRVLCHRDFHSRNLMVLPDQSLAVVDHQDARMGPDTYDLASLLFDAYVEVSEALAGEMTELFLAAQPKPGAAAPFHQRLDLMALQRTLKAAGTFAAQKRLHGRDGYLAFLPPVLGLARRCLASLPGMAKLRHSLGTLVEELQ